MNRTTMTMTLALGFILVTACSSSRSGDTPQRDAGSESERGEGGGPSLSGDAGRPMDAGTQGIDVVEAGTGSTEDAGHDGDSTTASDCPPGQTRLYTPIDTGASVTLPKDGCYELCERDPCDSGQCTFADACECEDVVACHVCYAHEVCLPSDDAGA